MNLKIGFSLLVYYSIVSLFFLLSSAQTSDFSNNIDLNETDIVIGEETDRGGLFNTGISFGRFFGFVTFGIGLPSSTPLFFKIFMFAWETLMSIFTVMFIIDSIWSG